MSEDWGEFLRELSGLYNQDPETMEYPPEVMLFRQIEDVPQEMMDVSIEDLEEDR